MHDLLPLALSIVGSLIAFLTTCLVGLLTYFGKYALHTVNDRIDDTRGRLTKLESDAAVHSNAIASAKTQTEAETRRFEDLNHRMASFENKIDELTAAVSELTGQLRKQS